MPENLYGSNVVNGPGKVVLASPRSAACKAFKAAVAKWCAKKPGTRKGKFNDYYFDAVAQQNGRFINPNTRETLLGVAHGRGAASNFDQLARSGGGLADGAKKARAAVNRGAIPRAATSGHDASRLTRASSVRSAFGKRRGSIKRVLFADGMLPDGSAFEIKGPGDGENPKNQPKAYANLSPAKKCVVVSCQSCNAEALCKSGYCK